MTNFYNFYREQGRDDLASKVFEKNVCPTNISKEAEELGHPADVIHFADDLDNIMWHFYHELAGFYDEEDETICLRIRETFTPDKDHYFVVSLYRLIVQLYKWLMQNELYEMIPAMTPINQKVIDTLRECYPGMNEKYFLCAETFYLHELWNEAKAEADKIKRNWHNYN